MKTLLLCLCLLSSSESIAAALQPVAPADPAAVKATPASTLRAEAAIIGTTEKYPLFAMLAEDDPEFGRKWGERLRLALLLAPKGGDDKDVALEAGFNLALDRIDPYLLRSSDAATNEFLGLFALLFKEAAADAGVCAMLLPGEGVKLDKAEQARIEAALAPRLIEPMILAMTTVVQTGRAGEARTLDESGAQDAMVPLLLSIGEKHGPDAINTIAHATDRSIEARKRCQAMYWFFDEINAQPEQQRADLIRTLWAMKGDK